MDETVISMVHLDAERGAEDEGAVGAGEWGSSGPRQGIVVVVVQYYSTMRCVVELV